MSKKSLFCSLALTSLSFIGLHADNTTENAARCGEGPKPMRVTMRHIEGNGVGYNQGYSTVEGFFAPWEMGAWVPFLDLRGHVFNDGKLAANAGGGVRYLTGSRVWGVNSYYDYRNTNHQHYNQVSVGAESLGRVWDFRVNGYLPVGDKSAFYDRKFYQFKGHHVILSRKREFAMKGANAEVGAHVDHFKNFPLYFAAGPYYLEGQGKATWGGELRASVDIFDYVRIEGNTSYDSAFKWISQGQLSLIIPFGGRRVVKQRRGNSCSMALTLEKRAVQKVDRSEIIPVDRERKKSIAIDPTTGKPYFYLFVNSGGHSDGSFESPYHELAKAQWDSSPGDVIYVFSGNGSLYDMSSSGAGGFIMKDNQKLFGSGTSHRIGTQYGGITIPRFSSELPMVTNSGPGAAVVTLANNCEVAGLHITGANVEFGIVTAGGVAGVGVVGGVVRDNWIDVTSTDSSIYGIAMVNAGNKASMSIINNKVSGITTSASSMSYSYGIYALNNGMGATLSLLNNNVSAIDNHSSAGVAYGILVENSGTGTGATFSLSNNSVSKIDNHTSAMYGTSIGMYALNNGMGATFSLLNNNVSEIDNNASNFGFTFGIWTDNSGGSESTFSLLNNSVSKIDNHASTVYGTSYGIYAESSGGTGTTVSLLNNRVFMVDTHTSAATGYSTGIWTESSGAGTKAAFLLQNNSISKIDNHASGSGDSTGGWTKSSGTGSEATFSLLNNSIFEVDNHASGGGSSSGILSKNESGGNLCLTLIGNTAAPSILLENTGDTFILNISSRDNSPTPTPTAASGMISVSTCSLP